MNKIKKALLLALSLAMSATLFAACGKNKNNGGGTSSSESSSTEVSTPVESDSSEVESDGSEAGSDGSEVVDGSSEVVDDSSEAGSDSSDGGVVTPATYAFTKWINRTDMMNGFVTSNLEEGAELDLSEPDAVEGKVFEGWFYKDGTAVEEGTLMGTEAVVIYAKWTITPYTVTIKQAGVEDVVLTFGVESNYDDLDNPIIGIDQIGFAVAGKIPAATADLVYSYEEELPEKWELQNYTFTVTSATRKYAFTKWINRTDMMNGATVSEVAVGDELDLSEPDAVEGKVFEGWFYKDGTAVEEGTLMGTEAVVIYAKWTITPYTVTITLNGEAYETFTFGAEGYYEEGLEIIDIKSIAYNVAEVIPEDTKGTKYTVTGMPEDGEWALQNYEIQITSEKIDDDDLASSIKFFDRLNTTVITDGGTVKTNKDNYWDGTASSVTVANQKEVTNGSDYAMKLTFDYNKLTAAEKAAGAAAYNPNDTTAWKGESWVAFAIPVSNLDLTNYEITFDMKGTNLGADISAYAAQDYEGEENALYAFGKEGRYKRAEAAEDLGDGWYRWTITIDCTNGVGEAADYIILSLDNTPNPALEAVAYIDNVSMKEVFYQTVTIKADANDKGVEKVVVKDSVYTPEVPSKDGYEFLGWVDGKGNPVDKSFTVTEDVTIIATWEKLPYQAKINEAVAIDLTETLMNDGLYELAVFSAPAGTYEVVMSGGIKAHWLVDGELGDEITQFVFTEETTVTFAITYGWDDVDTYTTGTISISYDYTQGLISATIEKQLIQDLYRPDQTNTYDENGVAYSEYRAFVNGSTATEVTEGIPEGYESVLRLDWYQNSVSLWKAGGNALYRAMYNQTSLSIYKVVRFGMKLETNGDAVIDFANGVKTSNEWVFFELIQTSEGVWTLIAKDENGAILYSTKEAVRYSGGLTNVDSVASLVFPQRWVGAIETQAVLVQPCSDASMTASIYTTEVIGWKEDVAFDTQISEDATRLWNHAWNNYYFTGQAGAEGAYSQEAAPAGYSYVSEYSFVGGDFPKTGHLNNSDVSAYSDLYFAMKVANGRDIYVQGGPNQAYTGGDWLYIHLHQEDDGKWTKTLRSPDGYEHTQTGLTGYQYKIIDSTAQTYEILREYPTLCDLLSYTYAFTGAGGTGSYPRGDKESTTTAYFTDVLAIRKDGTAITPPTAPGEEPEPEPTPDYAPEIPENAVIISNAVMNNNSSNLTAQENCDVAAPIGFDKVSHYFSASGNSWGPWTNDAGETVYNRILNTNDFDRTDISGYSEVWFAFKSTGAHITETTTWKDVDSDTDDAWIYFHLTQADDGTWTIEIVKDGKVWNTFTAQNGTTIGEIMDKSNDGSRIVFYQQNDGKVSTADVNIYVTEVVGVAKEVVVEPFDPAIPENAAVLWDHIWINHYFTGGGEPEGAYATDVAAPTGFSKVSYYDFTDRNYPKVGHFNNSTVISDYSDLYFAMKVVNGADIYLQGYSTPTQSYTGGDWLYVHMYQATDGTWSKDFYAADGFEFKGVQKGLTGTTLPTLMSWVSGINTGSYPRAKEDGTTTATAYFTDVLAVRKPYDPEISADAVKVYDSIWRSNNYALSATTDEAAPTGFTTVKEFNWLNNTTMVPEKIGNVETGNEIPYMSNSTDMGLTCFDEADMSNLTEFWFAMKQEGGAGFYVRGASKYTGGGWLYYHGTRAADNSWTLELTSEDGYTATQTGIKKELLKDILNYHATSEAEPWNGGAYPTRNVTYWVHKTTYERVDVNPNDSTNYVAWSDEESYVYFTEVYGVAKTTEA